MNSCTICTVPLCLKTSRTRGTGIVVFLAMNSLEIASVRRTRYPYFTKQRLTGTESDFRRGYIAFITLLQQRRSNFHFSLPWSSRTGGNRYDRIFSLAEMNDGACNWDWKIGLTCYHALMCTTASESWQKLKGRYYEDRRSSFNMKTGQTQHYRARIRPRLIHSAYTGARVGNRESAMTQHCRMLQRRLSRLVTHC